MDTKVQRKMENGKLKMENWKWKMKNEKLSEQREQSQACLGYAESRRYRWKLWGIVFILRPYNVAIAGGEGIKSDDRAWCRRHCEDLFERSESRSKMRGIVILSDPERATISLLVLPLCRYREKNRKNLIPGLIRDLLRGNTDEIPARWPQWEEQREHSQACLGYAESRRYRWKQWGIRSHLWSVAPMGLIYWGIFPHGGWHPRLYSDALRADQVRNEGGLIIAEGNG